MKIKLYLSALILASATLFTGCVKEGPVGPPGPLGYDGHDGNANVSASTYAITSWSSDSIGWYVDLQVPELTPTANSSGAVQVFFSTDLGNTWVATPWSVAGASYTMNFLTQTTLVEVAWDYVGPGIGMNPNSYFSQTTYLKVVVIPPAMRKSDVDYNNYQEIEKAYNLNGSMSANPIEISATPHSRSSFSIN